MSDIFERGTREGLRFNCKGVCTIEDLWTVPLSSPKNKGLKQLYLELTRELKDLQGERIGIDEVIDDDLEVTTKSKEEELLELKIEIVKHIFKMLKKEKIEKENEKKDREYNQKIMALIDEKEENDLRGKTKEELLALLKKKA